MKPWVWGAIALGTVACTNLPFGIGSPDSVPRWEPSATEPVLTQQWLDGFVPQEDWNVDTVRVYGSGRWEAERTFSSNLNKPALTIATGSLSPETMRTLLGTVFVRAEGGQRFLDLPERVDAGITDVPVTRVTVSIQNASHSVSVSGPKPKAFELVQNALSKQTVAVPFPD